MTTETLAAQALSTLTTLREDRERWDAAARAATSRARREGVSWARIGNALGLSDEGARRRFSTCACGKPIEHLSADEDTREWACLVAPTRRVGPALLS